jgi:putative heme-binding domain-containing protein
MLPMPASDGNSTSAPVDLAYDLGGFETTLSREDDSKNPLWQGWLPHADPAINKHFLIGSSEHEQFFAKFHGGTALRLHSSLVLPGAARLIVEANGAAKIQAGNSIATITPGNGLGRAEVSVRPDGSAQDLVIEFHPSAAEPTLHLCYTTDIDPTVRPLPFKAVRLPWAPSHTDLPGAPATATEIAGGDFERGRGLFAGERLKCITCHRLRGEGAVVGPDLSNLAQRDASSVLRDIKEPSASINPDYVAYNVILADDESLTGFVRSQNEKELRIISADGHERMVPRQQIKQLQVSAISLMPSGLLEGLKDGEIRDLLTFLLSEPPKRDSSDLANLLKAKAEQPNKQEASPLKPLRLVLVASKQDHGPDQHDYPAWQKAWPSLLEKYAGVRVDTAWEWPTQQQFDQASVVIFYFWNHDWNAARYEQLDQFYARGGGVVILHSATIADKDPEKLADRIGLSSQPGPTNYRHTPLDLKFTQSEPGSISEGFKELHVLDEPYWPMFGNTNRVKVLAAAEVDGASRPLIWTYTPGKGRVFASIPSHYTWTWSDPVFRVLLFRGIAWAAGEPPQRFDPALPAR